MNYNLFQASFVSAKGEEDIDIDDPNFWQKWAKKAELDVDYLNKVCINVSPKVPFLNLGPPTVCI